jgi:hypothetical protein
MPLPSVEVLREIYRRGIKRKKQADEPQKSQLNPSGKKCTENTARPIESQVSEVEKQSKHSIQAPDRIRI